VKRVQGVKGPRVQGYKGHSNPRPLESLNPSGDYK
jgi:hypothetical protein